MAEIALSGGIVAFVDDADVEAVSAYSWHPQKAGSRTYARTNLYLGGGKAKPLYMHQLIANRSMVDHWDRNGLNNRRDNLRPCTQSQNIANSVKRSTARTSPYKGVSRTHRSNMFRAEITVNYKTTILGYFSDGVKAAIAYDAAAVKSFGDFARTNFPVPEAWRSGDFSSVPRYIPNRRSSAKLTVNGVREIRRRYAEGAQVRDIAVAYAVSNATLRDLLNGRTWKDVE